MNVTVSKLDAAAEAALEGMVDGPAQGELSRNITAHVLLAVDQLTSAKRRVDDDLFRKDVAYAVPDDTLGLVPSLVKAAVACFTTGALAGVPELVGLLMRYEQLKVKLSGDEAAIIRMLKKARADGEGSLPVADI